jgi:hypothetical protein
MYSVWAAVWDRVALQTWQGIVARVDDQPDDDVFGAVVEPVTELVEIRVASPLWAELVLEDTDDA